MKLEGFSMVFLLFMLHRVEFLYSVMGRLLLDMEGHQAWCTCDLEALWSGITYRFRRSKVMVTLLGTVSSASLYLYLGHHTLSVFARWCCYMLL